MEENSKIKNIKKGQNSTHYFSIILKSLFFIFNFILILVIPISFFSLYVVDDNRGWKIVDFLKNAGLPLIILIFILTFKNNLAKFIDELKHLKIFGNEATRETPTDSQVKNLSVEKISEEIKDSEGNSKLNNESEELKKTKLYLEYERIYNIIFGSQIELLDILKINKMGLNMNFLGIYFYNIQKKFENALGSWTLFGYLRFLETNGLIQFDNMSSSYLITVKGEDFLNYIELLKYSKVKSL